MLHTTIIDGTPAAGVSCWAAAEHSAHTAPVVRVDGTAVPFAGLLAQVAFGARVIDLPGVPPRGAPV